MTQNSPTIRDHRDWRPPLRRRLFTVLGALLTLAPPLLGESSPSGESSPWGRDVEFEHLTTEDGLSHSTVWDVLQDRQGFLWFATGSLLQRYDGYEFTSFQHDPDDPESVTAQKILEIFEDRQGILWFGARNLTIDRFNPATQRFSHFLIDPDPGSSSEDAVTAFHEDRSGALWVGSYSGLHRFHPEDGSFTNYPHDPADPGSISSGPVWTILEDRLGALWVGTSNGLDRFDRKAETFEHFRHDPDDPTTLSNDDINSIYEDSSGELWIGTQSGLDRFDRKHVTFIRHSLAPGDSIGAWRLLEDRDGELWIGTLEDGIFRTDRAATGRTASPEAGENGANGERFVHLRHDPDNRRGLGSDRVRGLWLDGTGILWIAHRSGVDKVDPRRERFVKYRREDGDLAGSKVWGMTEDRAGVLWISSHNGGLTALDRRRPKRGVISHYRHQPEKPQSLLSSRTTAVLADSGDELWIGHLGDGLSRMDRQRRRVTRYAHDPRNPASLADSVVTSLLEDRSGAIWVGFMDAGVQRYNHEQDAFVSYPHDAEDPRSLRSNKAYALLEDRAGNLWVGTYGGLSRFDPASEGFVHTTHDPDDRNSLSSNSVTSIHQDSGGSFWIGTSSGGLNRWHRERDTFRHYRVKDGLPSDDVVGIVEDHRGRLWLATKQGLACLDPQTGKIRRYDTADGLHGNSFFIGPAYRTRDGEVFFGGHGGVTAFFPDRITEDPVAPPVAITDFQILNRSTPLAERLAPGSVAADPSTAPHLILGYRDDIFAFEFAALHFATPGKNRYAYRLEGFQPDWVETDAAKRFAQYTNLDPGDYVFRVKAANRDGIWNQQGASVRVTVRPPPWRTWWAYGLYLLGLTALVATYLRGQRHKLERERQIAERESASAERERAASRRLRQADKLKDEFLANTSHELRTPLYGITGLAESLIDGGAGELPEAARSHLAMLVASGRRLTSLVNDILDFSKLKHRSLELDRKPVDLHALVEVVLVLSRPLVQSEELRLVNAVPTDLPTVDADEGRLQQILHNLVGNALKFTESGSVEVGAELDDGRQAKHGQPAAHGQQAEHPPEAGQKNIVVRVADTGIGISKDEQDRIFRAFEQADASIERQHGGTGLGLSITRKLVELHSGRLWLESQPAQGSTFFFTLPPAGEAAEAEPLEPKTAGRPPDPPTTGPDAGEHQTGEPATVASAAALESGDAAEILIVDDEPVIRQVLVNQLASRGYRLRQAANGADALAQVEAQRPDLVLLDVMMPRMSGYEVCRTLRQQHPLDELPVIFLTAKTQPSDLVVGLAAGANDYLPKPISKSELLARVETHLDLLDVHRQLSLLVDERTSQLREREQLLSERERLIDQLESRNAELARFNYTIAHDLKNPLTTIKNFVGMVARDAEAGDQDRLHQDLRRVDQAADQLQLLLEELYELSRVERSPGPCAEVPLGELFREAVDQLSGVIATRAVDVSIAPELPVVCGNRDQLRDVARHLLNNAVSYLGDQPTPRVEVGVRETEAGPVVYVQDNGIGLDPRYAEKVFGLFERLDPKASDGTGVGLALVQRIVEVHDGKVWVESEGLGKGSTFCISLPVVPQTNRNR